MIHAPCCKPHAPTYAPSNPAYGVWSYFMAMVMHDTCRANGDVTRGKMCESLIDAHLRVLTYVEPNLEAGGAKLVIHERVHYVILALSGNVRDN